MEHMVAEAAKRRGDRAVVNDNALARLTDKHCVESDEGEGLARETGFCQLAI